MARSNRSTTARPTHLGAAALVVATLIGLLTIAGPTRSARAERAPAATVPTSTPATAATDLQPASTGDLTVVPVSPAPGTAFGGPTVEISIRVSGGTAPDVTASVTLGIVGPGPAQTLPLTYDPLSGLHRTTVSTLDWFDQRAVYLTAHVDDRQAHEGIVQWVADLRNAPTVTVERPTATARGTTTGDLALVVRANDATTPPEQLDVRARVAATSAVRLRYDRASERFVGARSSLVVPDGYPLLEVTVTDGDGFIATETRDLAVRNDPGVNLALDNTVDSFLQFEVFARRADNGTGDVDVSWQLDGGTPRPITSVLGSNGLPRYLVRYDARTVPTGQHTVKVTAVDRLNGRRKSFEQTVEAVRNSWFGLGLLAPLDGTKVSGVVPIDLVAYRAGGNGGSTTPSVWFQVDGGAWVPLTLAANGHVTGSWDTRKLKPGSHRLVVVATDWFDVPVQRATVEVVDPNRLSIAIATPTQTSYSGTARVEAVSSGGHALAGKKAISAWFRVDGGDWQAMTGPPTALAAAWDTATTWPGSHKVEVIATDYLGGIATASVTSVVSYRLTLDRVQVGPVGGTGLTSVAAVLGSTTRPTTTLRAWARVDGGDYLPMAGAPNGYFRVDVDLRRHRDGDVIPIEVVAADDGTDTRLATTTYTYRIPSTS